MSQGNKQERYLRLVRVVAKAVRDAVKRSRSVVDVEDLIGEVWLHILERRVLEKVNPERGSEEALVYVAARNRALSLLRKRRLLPWQIVPADDETLKLEVAGQGPDPVEVCLAHRDLLRVLGVFSEDDRELILLSLLHDLTAAEILEVRGEPADGKAIESMQKRLQRLKKRLGELLDEAVSTPVASERKVKKGAP